jgi:tRNA(fMet)-specific endonuclease VapC
VSLLLLDTTVLIDAEREPAAVDEVIADDDDTAIAAVTVAELQVGAALADGMRRTARQAFIDAVVAVVPVISYDLPVAMAHARLLVATRKSARPRGAHDLIIAATAVAGGRVVVTADPTGFADLPDVEVRHHG